RHVLEVHAVEPGEKTQGHENGGEHGEDAHGAVELVGTEGDIAVHQIPRQFIVEGAEGQQALVLFVDVEHQVTVVVGGGVEELHLHTPEALDGPGVVIEHPGAACAGGCGTG